MGERPARVGSYEEVTPNVPSFVFRRRRWAAGHSHAFFAHLPALLRSRSGVSRLLVLAVGQFYLVPVIVAVFFGLQGAYYFALVTVEVRAGVLATSAAIALALVAWLSRRRSTKLSDFFVCWLVVLPHVSMNGALVYLLREAEAYYFVTSFPHQGEIWLAQALFFVLGLVTFSVGAWRTRALPFRRAVVFLVTSPVVVALDLMSALLGFSDFLLGRREWSRIDRRAEYEQLDEGLRARLVQTTLRVRSRWRYALYAAPVAALVLVGTNDVLSVGPCGDVTPLLWDPLPFRPDGPPVLAVDIEPRAEGGRARVLVRARIRAGEAGPLALRIFDGEERVGEATLRPGRDGAVYQVELDWPLGWDTRHVRVSVSGVGRQCTVDRRVPTRVDRVVWSAAGWRRGPTGSASTGSPSPLRAW